MNNYEIIIIMLIIICFISIRIAYYFYVKNKINYNNYQNALRALSDTDPSLKEYMKNNKQFEN